MSGLQKPWHQSVKMAWLLGELRSRHFSFALSAVVVVAARHLFVKNLKVWALPTYDLVLEHTQQIAELLTSITLCSLRNWPIMICSKCFGSFSPRLFKKTRVGKAVYRPDNNKVGEKLFLMTLLIIGLKRKQHDWITTYYIDLGQIQLYLLWINGRLIC